MKTSSTVRAAGSALSALLGPKSSRIKRALLLGGSQLAARQIDPGGLQPIAFTPSGDVNLGSTTDPDLVTEVTGAAAWVVLNLVADRLLAKLHLPRLVRAAALGAGVYAADVAVSGQRRPA